MYSHRYFSLANDKVALRKFLHTAIRSSEAFVTPATSTEQLHIPANNPSNILGNHVRDHVPSGVQRQPPEETNDDLPVAGLIQFDVYCRMLNEMTIRDLKPASLRLDADDFDESIRGKRWSEIPLRDNLIGLARRIQQEGTLYSIECCRCGEPQSAGNPI